MVEKVGTADVRDQALNGGAVSVGAVPSTIPTSGQEIVGGSEVGQLAEVSGVQFDGRVGLPVPRQFPLARGLRPLTPRQRQVLALVVRGAQAGMQPSYREMAAELGLLPGNIHEHLTRIQRKGYVRLGGGAGGRRIDVLAVPPGMTGDGAEWPDELITDDGVRMGRVW